MSWNYSTGDAASYHLNIIILLSSYPFISLVNCPWLLFIIILLSYSFMALSGFLFIYIIIAINYWIRDVIREYTKKYEVLIIMLFIVFLVFVFSEALLFLSFFWVFFHSSCSSKLTGIGGTKWRMPEITSECKRALRKWVPKYNRIADAGLMLDAERSSWNRLNAID